MKKNRCMIIIRICCMLLMVSAILPMFAVSGLVSDGDSLPCLNLSVRTDRGYYPPGEVIRVLGSVTTDSAPVNASVQFTFQGRQKLVQTGKEGSFLVSIPVSGSDPEDMYPLEITADAPGFQDKKTNLPIIVMGEPSSLAPEPQVLDEFRE